MISLPLTTVYTKRTSAPIQGPEYSPQFPPVKARRTRALASPGPSAIECHPPHNPAMRRAPSITTSRAALLALALSQLACSNGQGRENNTFDSLESSETDTDTDTEDESGTAADCDVGSLDCACTPGGFCDGELVCEEDICQLPDTSGDGDGDTSGDGDGDTDTSGDGDGDTNGDGDGDTDTGGTGACVSDEFLEIAAVDADEILGWTPSMSMLGEGIILAYDEDAAEDYVHFDIDIPCDDNWHIWVRGVDQNNMDSYFVAVDTFPNPPGIMELDCTGDPGQATYVWRELNYRDADNGPCEAVQDPWVLPWDAGVHTLEFSYRESLGLSRLYLSNTEQPPP